MIGWFLSFAPPSSILSFLIAVSVSWTFVFIACHHFTFLWTCMTQAFVLFVSETVFEKKHAQHPFPSSCLCPTKATCGDLTSSEVSPEIVWDTPVFMVCALTVSKEILLEIMILQVSHPSLSHKGNFCEMYVGDRPLLVFFFFLRTYPHFQHGIKITNSIIT